jgi:hypothetical protein
MYICMYVLALGLPPGGITCPYLTLSGAHVPRQPDYFDQREQGPRRTRIRFRELGRHDYNM